MTAALSQLSTNSQSCIFAHSLRCTLLCACPARASTFVSPPDLPTAAFARALTTRLPADVRVTAATDAERSFHPRDSAQGKRYQV